MPRLLLIDDDEQLGPPLAAYFKRFAFDLQHAKRPSTGISPMRWDEVIGRTSPRDFAADELIEI